MIYEDIYTKKTAKIFRMLDLTKKNPLAGNRARISML
jgi:hypothetical protein